MLINPGPPKSDIIEQDNLSPLETLVLACVVRIVEVQETTAHLAAEIDRSGSFGPIKSLMSKVFRSRLARWSSDSARELPQMNTIVSQLGIPRASILEGTASLYAKLGLAHRVPWYARLAATSDRAGGNAMGDGTAPTQLVQAPTIASLLNTRIGTGLVMLLVLLVTAVWPALAGKTGQDSRSVTACSVWHLFGQPSVSLTARSLSRDLYGKRPPAEYVEVSTFRVEYSSHLRLYKLIRRAAQRCAGRH